MAKKKYFFFVLLLLLCISSFRVLGFVGSSFIDSFGNGSNCVNDVFSCGNTTDFIGNVGGDIIINFTSDDPVFNYTCLVESIGGNSYVRSCLMRSGMNTSFCNGTLAVLSGGTLWNTSYFYNCPSSSFLGCGWNGLSSIPKFGVSSSSGFQLNTGVENRTVFTVVSLFCNNNISAGYVSDITRTVSVSDRKGVFCSSDGYVGGVYVLNNHSLFSDVRSCAEGSFCDNSVLQNFSIGSSMNGSFCIGGCDDGIKDGNETDVDYGGVVCGNCTILGKSHDDFYVFSRDLQVKDVGFLRPSVPFNISYCPAGRDVGGSIIQTLFLLFLISSITIIFFIILLAVIYAIFAVIITNYIRKKMNNKQK